jgi:hypothetical protein
MFNPLGGEVWLVDLGIAHEKTGGPATEIPEEPLFCDGSVRAVSYSVDRTVFQNASNRADGAAGSVPRT